MFFDTHLEQQNETGDDSLLLVESDSSIYFCIADGAGGTGNGLNASQVVVNAVKDLAKTNRADQPDDFETILRKLDLDIFENNDCGETTAVIGKVTNGVIIGASVGDSEAWIFNDDFDFELTSYQHHKPLLGSHQALPIGFGPMECANLVAGSDGLFKYTNFSSIKQTIGNASSDAKDLAKLAKKETGCLQDDISVILIKNI